MSWQTYVDSNLVGSGRIAKAAIIGQLGGVWAASSGYTLSPAEQTAINNAFKPENAADPNLGLSKIQRDGLLLSGQKFFCLRGDERSIYLKKGADGAVVVKTKQAILVTEYIPPTQAGEATSVVEGLADYLISVSY
ncbi:Profilin/allergen [Tricholoma matsutake]|nr:Profilin/allergen [Tricholoma matsutake 945]